MSEIRVDTIKAEDGISSPSFPSGISVTGVVTATSLQTNVASLNVGSNIHLGNAGVCTATSFSGSGASLTSLPAGNLTGALPAISGANLTGITQAVKKIYSRRDGARHSVTNYRNDNNYGNMWNWNNMQQVITPQSATSQFHITGSLSIHHYSDYEGSLAITYQHSGLSGETAVVSNSQTNLRHTHRGSAGGNTGSNMMSPTPLDLIIAPATTNPVTFRIRLSVSNSGYPWYVNRDGNNSTDTNDGGGVVSSWTITELDGAQVTLSQTDVTLDT